MPIELRVSHRSALVVALSDMVSKISCASARNAWMRSSSSSVLGLCIMRTTAWYCLILPTCSRMAWLRVRVRVRARVRVRVRVSSPSPSPSP